MAETEQTWRVSPHKTSAGTYVVYKNRSPEMFDVSSLDLGRLVTAHLNNLEAELKLLRAKVELADAVLAAWAKYKDALTKEVAP